MEFKKGEEMVQTHFQVENEAEVNAINGNKQSMIANYEKINYTKKF